MAFFKDNGPRGGGGFKGGYGGKPSFQKKSWGDKGGDREFTMHKATCGECGKSCEVPFRPSGERPVYCSDCFGSKKDDMPRRDFNDRAPRRDFGGSRPDFKSGPSDDGVKKQLEILNSKLDRLIDVIERVIKARE